MTETPPESAIPPAAGEMANRLTPAESIALKESIWCKADDKNHPHRIVTNPYHINDHRLTHIESACGKLGMRVDTVPCADGNEFRVEIIREDDIALLEKTGAQIPSCFRPENIMSGRGMGL